MKNLNYLLFLLLLTSCFKKEVNDSSIETIDSAAAIVDSVAAIIDSAAALVDSSGTYTDQNAITENLSDYELAERENTSSSWKRFLENHPNYENAEEIKEKIIRLEVQEIMADQNTGTMPESEKISTQTKSVSTMEVSNDTNCELTLRYSGTDAIMITIPSNSTKKIKISSGSYSVAASACGYNYAGRESLNGDYSVTYYIVNQYR